MEVDFNEIEKKVIEYRRYLHANPEPSFEEYKTTEFIANELEKLKIFDIKRLAKTGVVADFYAKNATKTIAFRGDIDALILEEKGECEFASKNKGVMHACGHDAHTAILLGLAHAIAKSAEKIKQNVRLIFQSGEELAPGGAKTLVDLGVMDGVDSIFALHLMPGKPSGTISIKPKIASANKDTFDIFVNGKGGHSSMPQNCIDPILVASAIVVNLQSVVSRNINPFSTAVVSTASFNSGSEYGVIPHDARITGAVRSFDNEIRNLVKEKMKSIVEGTAKAYGANAKVVFPEWDYSAIYNDPKLCEWLFDLIKNNFGEKQLIIDEFPQSFSEDFSEYLTKSRGVMVWLGIDHANKQTPKLHSPYFDPDENAFIVGVKYFYSIAKEFSNYE